MSVGTLWTIPIQSQGHRIRAVAAYGGVEITLAEGYEHRVTNKTPEFTSKFASGKIPAFETTSGLRIFETSAIARYIAALAKNSTLLPTSIEEQALVDQWVSFADSELFAHARTLNGFINGGVPWTKPVDTLLREKIKTSVTILESYLATRTYLVGERITLADISVASVLKYVFERYVDAAQRASLKNTVRFYETIANNPKIKPVFGETAYVEKALQYVAPAKPKKEAAAPAPPKEKAAPKPAAPKDDDEEDEDAALKEEPKAKNPLDSLPKSTFNLEDWKRAYSNMDTRGAGGSLEWFYSKFDKEGFSIWRVDFKYNEELDLIFKSSNQIGGFFNRLEGSRKYLFGSLGVLGEANKSVISGVFILRGLDYKPVVEVAPDWESYEYKQINLEDAADKAFFESALAWDLEVDGKKWADGKNFK